MTVMQVNALYKREKRNNKEWYRAELNIPGRKVRANTRRKVDTAEVCDLTRDYDNNYCVRFA